MAYIGKTPAAAALTSSDISDGIIITDKLAANAVVTSKITDGTIATADIANSAITNAKVSSTLITGQTAITGVANDDLVLISDTSGSAALKKMTVANLVANAGGGKIGQVVKTVKDDTFTSSSTSFTDITGMTVNITPSASNSKVLVILHFNVGMTTADRYAVFQMLRGSTVVGGGTASSSRNHGIAAHVRATANGTANEVLTKSMTFLDSPSSTSELTYKLQGLAQSAGSPSFTINRSGADVDAGHGFRLASSITLMEVLA